MEIPRILAPAGMIVNVGGTTAVGRKTVYHNASKSLPIKFGVARKVIAVSCPKKRNRQINK